MKIALSVMAVFYPLLVYLGLQSNHTVLVFIAVILFMTARAITTSNQNAQKIIAVLGIFAVVALGIFMGPEIGMRSYPIIINASLFAVFFGSLFASQNIIEVFARKFDKQFHEGAVSYTRKVCVAWCVFFVINAGVSIWSLFQTPEIWAFYNGVLSYILIGLMFIIEMLIRKLVKKKANHDSTTI